MCDKKKDKRTSAIANIELNIIEISSMAAILDLCKLGIENEVCRKCAVSDLNKHNKMYLW